MSQIIKMPEEKILKKLGISLQEVEIVSVDSNRCDLWFQGDNCDFFIWKNDQDKIIKQQLTFILGEINFNTEFVAQWEENEGIQTGTVQSRGAQGMGALTITFDENSNPEVLEIAKKIIDHATLSHQLIKESLQNF